MKYKLKDTPKTTVIDTVLQNRNILDINMYLDPPKDMSSPLLLNNLKEGIETLSKHLENNSKIAILVDCDVDGYTSSAIMYLYLKFLSVDTLLVFHEGKEHGLEDEKAYNELLEIKPNLLIIPDASSNESNLHNQLIEHMDIIVLDHHLADNYKESKAIIINNQISDNFTNKNLSGVGVVYKFLQELDKKLNLEMANVLLDLVAIGNIADMMNLHSLETRYLVLKGLSQICNPLLNEIKTQEEIDNFTITDVAFKVAPLFNAIIRVGSMDEKIMLFNALIGKEETIEYKYRGQVKSQTLQQAVLRIGRNAKTRQNNLVKKYAQLLKNQIEDNNFLENKVLLLNTTDIFETLEVSGLVATKLANEYKRPVLLLKHREDNSYGGSARGYGEDSFKDICEGTGLFDFAQGHNNAFGVQVSGENVLKLNSVFNDIYKDKVLDICYEVDYVFNAKELKVTTISQIAKLEGLWGCFIDEPLFAIKGIKVNSGAVKKFGTLVAFEYNGIRYNKNYATSDYIDKFTCGKERGLVNKDLDIEIICRFKKYKNGYFCEIVDYSSKISNELIF